MLVNYVKLTPKEITVLKYLSEGMSNEEIAEKLNRHIYTVRGRIQNIYSKLGLSYGKNNYWSIRVKAALYYQEKYGIKENDVYKKGYNDGIRAVLKCANALLSEG